MATQSVQHEEEREREAGAEKREESYLSDLREPGQSSLLAFHATGLYTYINRTNHKILPYTDTSKPHICSLYHVALP